jgi:DNA-binding SARP family transcriptional activator
MPATKPTALIHPALSPAAAFGDLAVLIAGPFAVYRAGRPVPRPDVGSRKARTLLALLAVQSRRVVGVDRIVAVLWGDRPPSRCEANVSTLVSRLRATLGSDVIAGDRTGYRLGASVRVDLDVAAGLIANAESALVTGAPARALADRALALLDTGGVLVDEPDAAWAESARVRHDGLLRRAIHAAGEAALRDGDPRRAGRLAEAAVEADPLDETACRALMRAHAVLGETSRALEAYQRLRATLAEELGVDPAPPTRDLLVAVLQYRVAVAA